MSIIPRAAQVWQDLSRTQDHDVYPMATRHLRADVSQNPDSCPFLLAKPQWVEGSRTRTWCDWWGTTWGCGPSLTMAAVRHGQLGEGIATSFFMAGKAPALILALSVWIWIYCLKPWAIIHGHGSLQEAKFLFGMPDSRGKS